MRHERICAKVTYNIFVDLSRSTFRLKDLKLVVTIGTSQLENVYNISDRSLLYLNFAASVELCCLVHRRSITVQCIGCPDT